jgi:hypothetical protein
MANNTNIDFEFTDAGFNLAEWRANLSPGDIAFRCSRSYHGPVTILEWDSGRAIQVSEERDVFVIFRHYKCHVNRSSLYPRRPSLNVWITDEMIMDGKRSP